MFLLIQLSQNACLQYCIMVFKNSVLQCSCAKYRYLLFQIYKRFEIYCTTNQHHVENGQLICRTNPLTGFYIIRILGARYFRVDFRYGYHRICYQKYTHIKKSCKDSRRKVRSRKQRIEKALETAASQVWHVIGFISWYLIVVRWNSQVCWRSFDITVCLRFEITPMVGVMFMSLLWWMS